MTISGPIRIENVRKGDTVWSYSDGKFVPCRVIKTIKDVAHTYLIVSAKGIRKWQVTPTHRFLVQSEGWTEARDLKTGDKLVDFAHRNVVVQDVEWLEEDVEVYNVGRSNVMHSVQRWIKRYTVINSCSPQCQCNNYCLQ